MVRLGGIYALERIARDSEYDHWPVMEILTAFVREQAPAQSMPPDKTAVKIETKESRHSQRLLAMIQTLLAINTGLRPHQRKELAEFEAFLTTTLGHPESTTTHEKSDSQVNTALEPLAQQLLPIVQLQWAALTSLKSLEQNLRPDLQAILTVLGRRVRTFGNGESQQLDLHNTNLQNAKLGGAQLQGVDLSGAQLQGAFLGGAQLQNAFLAKAQLQGAFVANAQLQGARLEDAQLQGAFLVNTQLQGARLEYAQLQGAFLWKTQFLAADLTGAQLQDANLAGAQLLHANLTGAQLQGAFLGDTQLPRANLTGAQLQGVDLRKAQNLTQEQINTACVDETTTLPEGLTKPAPCPANP
jgi:uncharacterized protein YjbI with pentapeptide repeats